MNFDLMFGALDGDETATKIYCGSYTLVRSQENAQLYRCSEDKPPAGFNLVIWLPEGIYDKDGFLLSQYWSLPRVYPNGRTA